MTEHLSEQSIEQYRLKAMASAELLAADEHLAKCDECHGRIGDPAQLKGALDSFFANFTKTPTANDDHLSYEQLEAYVDDKLDHVGREIADVHLGVCPECAEELRQLNELAAVPAFTTRETSPSSSNWNKFSQFLHLPYETAWFRFAAVALVLVTLGAVVWIFLMRSRQPQNQLIESRSPVDMGLPAPSTEGPPSIDRQAQEQPQPSASPNSSPRIVVELNDGSGRVMLNETGGVNGLPPDLPASYQEQVKIALSTQRLNTATALEGLGAKNGVLMGASGEGVPFALIGPVGAVVLSSRPNFRWRSLSGASNYVVRVFDLNFKEIAKSPPQSGTEWKATAPLLRGAVYIWQVTAIKNGEEIKSPAPPASEARFRILAQDKLLEVDHARKVYANSHLILGTIYAHAGLLQEAESEFRSLLKNNPGSAVAAKLLREVTQKRESNRSSQNHRH